MHYRIGPRGPPGSVNVLIGRLTCKINAEIARDGSVHQQSIASLEPDILQNSVPVWVVFRPLNKPLLLLKSPPSAENFLILFQVLCFCRLQLYLHLVPPLRYIKKCPEPFGSGRTKSSVVPPEFGKFPHLWAQHALPDNGGTSAVAYLSVSAPVLRGDFAGCCASALTNRALFLAFANRVLLPISAVLLIYFRQYNIPSLDCQASAHP